MWLVYRCFYPQFYRCSRYLVNSPVKLRYTITACTADSVLKCSEAFQHRPPGAQPPCRGCASLPTARLNNAFWQIHRRGPGAPGPDQGCPLWLRASRWTRRAWAIHAAALSRLAFVRIFATPDSAAGPPVWRRWGWPHFAST